MKKSHAVLLITITAMAAVVLSGCSKESGLPMNTLATPEETVKAYCDLDAQGVRLTSTTWSKVLPYISWTEEAGFDRAVVISGFSVSKVQKKNDKESMIIVEYQVLGSVSGDYIAGRKAEAIRFTVAKTDRGWKITEPDFMPPHVLAQAMARHLEGTKKSETAAKVMNDK